MLQEATAANRQPTQPAALQTPGKRACRSHKTGDRAAGVAQIEGQAQCMS